MKGLFITLEGIDGCGKTTQAKRIFAWLDKTRHPVIFTREPGGTAIAEEIRSIILDARNKAMAWKTELLLYTASRAQHVAEKIVPALKQGKIIICDRYFDATLAYQGYGRDLDRRIIFLLHRIATGDLYPDLTFIFDLPVSMAQARIARDGKKKDRMENETRQFQEKVRQGYLAVARKYPGRCRIIDATQDLDTITELVRSIILTRLQRKERH